MTDKLDHINLSLKGEILSASNSSYGLWPHVHGGGHRVIQHPLTASTTTWTATANGGIAVYYYVAVTTTANVTMNINGVAVSRLLYPVQWMRGNDGIYPVQAGDVVTLTLSAAIPNPGTTALEVYFYPAK